MKVCTKVDKTILVLFLEMLFLGLRYLDAASQSSRLLKDTWNSLKNRESNLKVLLSFCGAIYFLMKRLESFREALQVGFNEVSSSIYWSHFIKLFQSV